MKSKGTVTVVSLGCAKNQVDLQVRLGDLLTRGWTMSSDPDAADLVIVNTCSFIASAREEAEAEIQRALALKEAGAYGRVIVTGCYPQRYPEAAARFPGVDGWEGVPARFTEPKMPALRLTGKAFAYLKIAEGCSHRCAYCAIPLIRGPYRSRGAESIVREAAALVASGCRELNIVAQDPMLWRDGKLRLADLLWRLDEFAGDYWVRVLYSYPNEITPDFINWMNRAKHAVKYVDVPLQHTVPEVLAKMNRGAAAAATVGAAERLRREVPGVTLRTTVMTGFPGETAPRFRQMLADLERMDFDRVGTFAFSPERGTAAATMRGRCPRAEAERREAEVRALAERLWKRKARRLVGSEQRALVVAPGIARLASQAPDVDGVVRCDPTLPIGEFIDLTLRRVRGFDFVAE